MEQQKKVPTWASASPSKVRAVPPKTNDANLPAFFQIKGQDGSSGYNGAPEDDSRILLYNDDPSLWTKLWGPDAPGIKMDKVSVFSVTSSFVADEMSRTLLALPGVTPESKITDATACVGGNTASFARFFATVNAVEMDPGRCDILFGNIEFCRKNASSIPSLRKLTARVNIYCENCLDIVGRLHQDVIFLDPPWGGKDYKSKTAVCLYLGAKPLHEVILSFSRHAMYVAVKIPKNADLRILQSDLRLENVATKCFPSFDMLVLKSSGSVRRPIAQLDGRDYRTTESLLFNLVSNQQFHEVLYRSANARKN